jgi:hypothetical protein
MFTLKPESKPGTDDAMKIFRIIPKIINAIPRYKQFFAFGRSSCRKIKNATIPPIIPKKIGSKNQTLLLGFSGCNIILYFYFATITFFCNCVISISTVSKGSST